METGIPQLAPEENLFLLLCSLNSTLEHKYEIVTMVREIKDWDHFLKITNELGIIAQCWYILYKTNNLTRLPARYQKLLHSAYLKSLTFNEFIFGHLKGIIMLAKKEAIKIVILKGLALEKTVYGNLGIRQISDIDILVEKQKAMPLRSLLIKNGYYTPPLISPLHKKILPYLRNHLPAMLKNGASVEIHVSLFDEKENSLTDELFKTAFVLIEDDNEIHYPQPQMHFLYLVKHLDHHEKTKELQLKSFVDLLLLLNNCQYQILNRHLFYLAEKAGLTVALTEKLVLFEIIWDFSFPEWIKEYTMTVNRRVVYDKFIYFIRNPVDYSKNRQSDTITKSLSKIPGKLNKIRFIAGYIFPSLSYMKYKYSSKSRMICLLYYPVRWVDVLKISFKSGRKSYVK